MRQTDPHPDNQDPQWRTTVNLLAAIVVLILIGVGYYLIDHMARAKRAQECLEAGRRNCGDLTAVQQ